MHPTSRTIPQRRRAFLGVCALAVPLLAGAAPATFTVVPGKTERLSVQAVGVQVYDCRADEAGQLKWMFREPLATLTVDGKTVGHHFVGPAWELDDGSRVTGKVVAQAPGEGEQDIALLQLQVTSHQGQGVLAAVDEVQRLDTRGGKFAGSCMQAGALHVEPYSARYVFFGR
ncbi:TPA: DUF3455 domain-containing protein [Pseudomonas putida]